jgi:uncharacterized protein with ParB-like and HNH nuclease domain
MERWNLTRTLYKVSDFVSWQRSGALELSPSFQRRPVWSASAKSYLIDTIVRDLPIPIVFIRERTDLSTLEPKRQIVDGQQRIRTVLSYVDRSSLKDYREPRDRFQVKAVHNAELAGKDFEDLPGPLKQRIVDYPFSVHVLPSDVGDKEVLQIFARMNATGVKLNYQELRNATYFGEFKQTMYDLAYEQLERWRNWGIVTENEIARMNEVEMTSDLVLLMYRGISQKSKGDLDRLYRDHEDKFAEKKAVQTRFRSVMDSIDDALGRDIRSTEFRKRTLFYGLFAFIYDAHYSLGSRLSLPCKKTPLPSDFPQKAHDVSDMFSKDKVPEEVSEAVTRRTSHVSSRKAVFGFVKRKCTGG